MSNPNWANEIAFESQKLSTDQTFVNRVAQAQSRSLLRRLESDPADWPSYSPTLDSDLTNAAYHLLWQGIQLKEFKEYTLQGDDLIRRGAEILEFISVDLDVTQPDAKKRTINSALGYYIAGHYAKSYVLMKSLTDTANLTLEENLVRWLFLKDFNSLRSSVAETLLNPEYSDDNIANTLSDADNDANNLTKVFQASLSRALSFFIEFPKSGIADHLSQAIEIISLSQKVAEQTKHVDWWWLFYSTKALVKEFQENSLWIIKHDYKENGDNSSLVDMYIRNSYRRTPPVIELWRTQIQSLPFINDSSRSSYCLKMPTSSGKTRIAELAILRYLIDYRDDQSSKCIYIAPFRSLAVEVERCLKESLNPLGVRVSELYGGFELSPADRFVMDQTRIFIATPEKVDAFIRYNPDIVDQIRLVIVDEGHIISPTERGIRFEFFLNRLISRFRESRVRFLFMSAVLPNANQFAEWITGDANNLIESDWRPSRLLIGELRWNGRVVSIHYSHSENNKLEHECYVTSFIQPIRGEELAGTLRRNPFPNNLNEATALTALRFAQNDATLIFVPQRRSVEPFGRQLLKVIEILEKTEGFDGERYQLSTSSEHEHLISECIQVAEDTLGSDSDFIKFLKAGFAVHHGGLPQTLRIRIEHLIRIQAIRLIVATTTLAQGVNLPIRTVIVKGIWHGRDRPLNPLDFWNICGRAGRALKENEGQVLFAIHDARNDSSIKSQNRASETRKQVRQELVRKEIVRGYREFNLVSGLRTALKYIVLNWRKVYPDVDVADLCILLAENNIDWVVEEDRYNFEELLEILDIQVLSLLYESGNKLITPEELQEILKRSLILVQLNAEPDGELTADLANSILYARLGSLVKRYPTESLRSSFYKLGIRLSDCEIVEEKQDELLEIIREFEAFFKWNVKDRITRLVNILDIVYKLEEFSPKRSRLSKNQLENWHKIWQPILSLWLRGQNPNDIASNDAVKKFVESPADISQMIEEMIVQKGSWGLNSLSAFTDAVLMATNEENPQIVPQLSTLLKYGVISPVASTLLSYGIQSRSLATRVSLICPDEAGSPQDILNWFLSLTGEQLRGNDFDAPDIKDILNSKHNLEFMRNPFIREQVKWDMEILLSEDMQTPPSEGDYLYLQILDADENTIDFFSQWGDFIGRYQVSHEVPSIWFSPEQIEVFVIAILKEVRGTIIKIRIREV